MKITQDQLDKYSLRKSRCGDCGFTEGTRANTSGVTAIKAKLCAETCEPFLCHFNATVDGDIPDGKEVLCQGWIETCLELGASGFYEKQPKWQRAFKLKITEAIAEIERAQMPDGQSVSYLNAKIQEFLAETKLIETRKQ